MNQVALEEQISRLEKEVRLGGSQVDERFLQLRADFDRLRLEVEAIKKFLGEVNPSFGEVFPHVLQRTIEEVNPEFE